jgi:CheY-like chemotaxis protein
MPDGGTLTIETANVDLDEAYARRHVAVVPGPYVMLALSDTGIGMDAETQAHLFEPFFTTKEVGKGTGLGLSTVYGIVKQSDGNLWVYSEPGRGTTFKVYLPRVEAPPPSEPAPEPATAAGLPRGTETVLVAEDEAVVRALVTRVLRQSGYDVIEARDALEALRRAEAHARPIDLLVTDLVMPEMSGRELAARLTAARPHLRVLYMSGYTDRGVTRQRGFEPGAAFLEKPFTPQILAARVRAALDAR